MSEILVAMSGGVDSSVAAALLVQQGHDVTGVTLKLWGGESDSGCCSVSDVEDARRVAQQLGIDHHVFNFGDDFDRYVIAPYVEAYDQGRTPNPCIECNRHIKFDKLLRRADALGFELVATGHHAKLEIEADGTRRIGRGADAAKDQSYVLHMLGQEQLRRLLFPVGDITKDRVRELATELGLRTADKPDSQDVCFIHSDGGRRKFLGDRIPLSPARIVDGEGQQLGSTDAVQLVTIGQRKGLGLAGNDTRHYVTEIDRVNGIVTVGTEDQTMCERTELVDLAWSGDGPEAVSSDEFTIQSSAELTMPHSAELTIQCSAHGSRLPGRIVETTSGSAVEWATPHRRVAAGQAVVFYSGDAVVGGATAR